MHIRHSWEIVNGLTLDVGLSLHRRTEVERSKFVLVYPDAPNVMSAGVITMPRVQMRKRMQKHSMMATLRDIPHMYMWTTQKRIRRFRTTVEHGTWASTTAVGCSVLSTTEIQ